MVIGFRLSFKGDIFFFLPMFSSRAPNNALTLGGYKRAYFINSSTFLSLNSSNRLLKNLTALATVQSGICLISFLASKILKTYN
jgi:hypothetical protein